MTDLRLGVYFNSIVAKRNVFNCVHIVSFVCSGVHETMNSAAFRYDMVEVEKAFSSIKGINSGFQCRTGVVDARILMGTKLKLFFESRAKSLQRPRGVM